VAVRLCESLAVHDLPGKPRAPNSGLAKPRVPYRAEHLAASVASLTRKDAMRAEQIVSLSR